MIDDNGSVRHSNGNGRIRVGQSVALTRGALAGMTGVLERFGDGQRCLIRLDIVERGVLLIIDAAAVRQRPEALVTGSNPEASQSRQPDREDRDCVEV